VNEIQDWVGFRTGWDSGLGGIQDAYVNTYEIFRDVHFGFLRLPSSFRFVNFRFVSLLYVSALGSTCSKIELPSV